MFEEEDPLKKLWFNPLVVRIRKNPWVKAIFLTSLIGLLIFTMNPLVVLLVKYLSTAAVLFLVVVIFRYTLFK